MAGSRTRTTVVIPTRDRWNVLPAALRSALGQKDVDVDVIVVDDASMAPAPREVLDVGGDRVTIIRLDASRGLAAARNAGISAARGDWIAFLDDDDLWSPQKLRRQLAATRQIGAGWAYSTAVMIDAQGNVRYRWPLPEPDRLFDRLVRSNAIPAGSSNVVASADLLRSLGGFDESFSRIADWDLWLRLASNARAAAVDEPLVGYRQHERNMSGAGRRALFAEFDRLERKHGATIAARGVRFDRSGIADWADRESRRRYASRAERHLLARRRLRAAGAYAASAVAGRRPGDLRRAVSVAFGCETPVASSPPLEQPDWLRQLIGALS